MEEVIRPEFFAYRVAEAYMYHAIAKHRRPVYRHEAGDIAINPHFIVGLMDDYLARKLDAERRENFYLKLLTPFRELIINDERDSRVIISTGVNPELNARGIRYLDAMLRIYGDMVMDINVKDHSGKFVIPENAGNVTFRLHS